MVAKYLRRGLIVPDFTSDGRAFFTVERLPALKQFIADNRQRNWRHMSSRNSVLEYESPALFAWPI